MHSILRKTLITLAALVGILIIAGIAAILMGFVYVGLKQPTESVAIKTQSVCNAQDIGKHNEYVAQLSVNENVQKERLANMQAQVDSIASRPGFENDPTCQFIGYAAAIVKGDAPSAQKYLNAVKALAVEGNFPSTDLVDLTSVESMSMRIKALDPNQKKNNPLGSG